MNFGSATLPPLLVSRSCAGNAEGALSAPSAAFRFLAPLRQPLMSNFGGVVTFDIKGGKPATFEALNRLQLVDISNNLGDAKSMVTHPATTTHMRIGAAERAKLGIGDGTVRISVGLEDVDDVIADLTQALG